MQAVRVMGSAALGLAFAACGRFDLFVHSFLYPWDSAAGILFVREGGRHRRRAGRRPVTIYSEGLVAGAPGPVQDLLAESGERLSPSG